jgi:hypothetical protein
VPGLVSLGLALVNEAFAWQLKVFFFILVYSALVAVCRMVWGAKVATVAGTALCVLQIAVTVWPYKGPFEQSQISWRSLDDIEVIKARLYTFPASARWSHIKSQDFTPYLYLSLSKLNPEDEIELVVNGHTLGNVPQIQDLKRIAGGYAVPLSPSFLFERPFLDVKLLLHKARGRSFFTASYENRDEYHPPQVVCSNGQCVPVAQVIGDLRFVIEVRITDLEGRVLGLLY